MGSRMERYVDNLQEKKSKSRLDKNKDLYDSFYKQTIYKQVGEIEPDNRAVDLNHMNLQENTTRENYQRIKEIQDVIDMNRVKKSEDLSVFFHENEDKIYDINSVLTAAKKNREEVDELDKKRKLRNTDYNVLTNMSPEAIANYKKESAHSISSEHNKTDDNYNQDNDLAELINTITTKSLINSSAKNEITGKDSELLEDLMPNSLNETVISESLSKDILENELQKESEKSEGTTKREDNVDHSFYTRSMDLSDTDFDEDGSDEFIEKKPSIKTFLIVLLAVIFTAAIAIYIYYLINRL
ncbi:MAG: hypothetical protein RSA48_03075 [Bacilli bacterium]